MKTTYHSLILSIIFLSFNSCSNSHDKESDEKPSSNYEQSLSAVAPQLSEQFLGIYHGIQPGYFMKNEYGDEMIIAGNKVPVPSIDFKFLLKENNIARLQNTNLEDNRRVYYDRTIKIMNDTTDFIKIECSLSDGNSSNPSNPTYILVMNKFDNSITCIPESKLNGPEFMLEKINSNSTIDSQGIDNQPGNSVQKNSSDDQNFPSGFYTVNASENHKVYFYNTPNRSIRRNAYINTQEEVFVQKIINGFGYVEFINSSGQKSIGWLDMQDLVQKP